MVLFVFISQFESKTERTVCVFCCCCCRKLVWHNYTRTICCRKAVAVVSVCQRFNRELTQQPHLRWNVTSILKIVKQIWLAKFTADYLSTVFSFSRLTNCKLATNSVCHQIIAANNRLLREWNYKIRAPKINKSWKMRKKPAHFCTVASSETWKTTLAKARAQNQTLSWFMRVITCLAKIAIHLCFIILWWFLCKVFWLFLFCFKSTEQYGRFRLIPTEWKLKKNMSDFS